MDNNIFNEKYSNNSVPQRSDGSLPAAQGVPGGDKAPPGREKANVDAILQEIYWNSVNAKISAAEKNAMLAKKPAAKAPPPQEKKPAPAAQKPAPKPQTPADSKAVQEMTAAVRALTEEVKQLRMQMVEKPEELQLPPELTPILAPKPVPEPEPAPAPKPEPKPAPAPEPEQPRPEAKAQRQPRPKPRTVARPVAAQTPPPKPRPKTPEVEYVELISPEDLSPEADNPFILSDNFVRPHREPQRGDSAAWTESQAEAQPAAEVAVKKSSHRALSIISNVLFYVIIVAMVLGALLLRSAGNGRPFVLAGFSAATVLTGSMEEVYPRGSLIVTKAVDAEELVVGDDITFMVSDSATVTHRIIGITENYQGTGNRAFETKGVMNNSPDKEPVLAANVVGKVVFHSKVLGVTATFIKSNWPFLLFFVVVVVVLVSVLKWNAKRSDTTEKNKGASPKKKQSAPKKGRR